MSHKKILTLCFIRKDDKVLLGMKKRGFGMGKWNGFGGKVQAGETVEEAARRELFEEAEINASDLEKIGLLYFSWEHEPNDIWEVNVFNVINFSGEPVETEEMKPQWFLVKDIPFDKMWPDDQYWFPLFLEGKKFQGTFFLSKHNEILKHELNQVDTV